MSHLRTLATAPARPDLTWWQRVLCTLQSPRRLAQRPWYRAHVGGMWCFYGGLSNPEEHPEFFRWTPRASEACGICNLCSRLRTIPPWPLLPNEARYLRNHDDHRCEVYPYPAAQAAADPSKMGRDHSRGAA